MKYYLAYKDIAGKLRVLDVGTSKAMVECLNSKGLNTILVEAGSTIPTPPVLGLVNNT